jgi:hypothetical protein
MYNGLISFVLGSIGNTALTKNVLVHIKIAENYPISKKSNIKIKERSERQAYSSQFYSMNSAVEHRIRHYASGTLLLVYLLLYLLLLR